MPYDTDKKLVVAISSTALFDLSEASQIYLQQGVDAYATYQIDHENEILAPGNAFALVKKLLQLNQKKDNVEIILLSRNSADTGLRVFNSIDHYQLSITRAAFTSGQSPYSYISAFGAHLFLSENAPDVIQALQAGCAAATILNSQITHKYPDQLRIAFDGDAVIFSDESEIIFQQQGLEAFSKNEQDAAKKPLPGGPFKALLAALHHLQRQYPDDACPIRTALITARSAPAHERVIRTLRAWGIRIDEALFLGGMSKGAFLESFGADVFFDDQSIHCESARAHVATGHVPSGVINQQKTNTCENE
jgi:5'-nucleotidase